VPYFGARSREIRQEAGFVQQDVIDYRRGKTASLCIGRGSERRRSHGYVQSGVHVIFEIGAAVLGITEAENDVAQPLAHAHGETNRHLLGVKVCTGNDFSVPERTTKERQRLPLRRRLPKRSS
jgi:hypothetical protein